MDDVRLAVPTSKKLSKFIKMISPCVHCAILCAHRVPAVIFGAQ